MPSRTKPGPGSATERGPAPPRPLAPHVRAAIGGQVQAKAAPAGVRAPAPHVAAAIRPAPARHAAPAPRGVQAKPAPRIARPVLQKASASKMDLEVTPAEFKSGYATHLGAFIDDGGEDLEVSGKTKSAGGAHAEDVFIDVQLPQLHALGRLSTAARNRLVLNLNRSPCTSTSRNTMAGTKLAATSTKALGCTERLIDLVVNGKTISGTAYTFSIDLIVARLYGSTSAARAASSLALEALQATGQVRVSMDMSGDTWVGVAEILST